MDEKHHVVVEQNVTNAVTDSDIVFKAKDAFSFDKVKVVADAEYCNVKEIQICDENGIDAYKSRIPTSINKNKGLYTKYAFRYDKKRDCYFCPAGEKLSSACLNYHIMLPGLSI